LGEIPFYGWKGFWVFERNIFPRGVLKKMGYLWGKFLGDIFPQESIKFLKARGERGFFTAGGKNLCGRRNRGPQ